MTNPITLPKFKAMSAQDLATALESGATISVEAAGQHLFDVVRPLNALDERFLSVSRYVGREVAAEFKRKIETMRVEDMFDSRNADTVLASVAAGMGDEAGTDEDAPKPAKAAAVKSKPAPRTAAQKKAASKPRPSRAKPKAALVSREQKAAPALADPQVEPNPVRAASAPLPVDDLDLEPFPHDTVPGGGDLNEDLVASEAPLNNVAHDDLDVDPYPESDDASDFVDAQADQSGPDRALFEGLKEMELTPEEIAAEDAGDDLDDDDDDDEFSEGPIIRNIARKRG